MNIQITTGTIGQDAVTKNINGRTYASFSIAVRSMRGETTWISILKKDPANIIPYLLKGTSVCVHGTPTANAYIKDGKPAASTTIWALSVELLSGRKNEQQQASPGNHAASCPNQDDDDLPF